MDKQDIRSRLAAAGVWAAEVGGDIQVRDFTRGQLKGPVWRGPLPRNVHRRASVAPPLTHAELGVGVVPGSELERVLTTLRRPERRLLLAAVASSNPVRRATLERSLRRRLA